MTKKISSGSSRFDETFRGYEEHSVTFFAQRPDMGTLVFMLNSAIQLAKAGQQVLFLSTDMTNNEFFKRTLANLMGIPVANVMNEGNLGQEEYTVFAEKAKVAVKEIGDRLRFAEKYDLAAMKEAIPFNQENHHTSIVFMDNRYQQLNEEEVEDLLQFANDEKVTIILATSLPRTIEKREDKKPLSSDISFAPRLKEEATIYGFYRDEIVSPSTDAFEVLEISLLSQESKPTIQLKIDVNKQLIV